MAFATAGREDASRFIGPRDGHRPLVAPRGRAVQVPANAGAMNLLEGDGNGPTHKVSELSIFRPLARSGRRITDDEDLEIAESHLCLNPCLKDNTSGPTRYSNAVRVVVGIITVAGMPG